MVIAEFCPHAVRKNAKICSKKRDGEVKVLAAEALHAKKRENMFKKSVKSHMVLYGDSSLKNSLEGILRAAFKTLMQR